MPSLILYAVLFLAVAGVIGGGVYKVKQWGAGEVRAEWEEAKATQREEEIQRSLNAAAGLSADRKKRKPVIQEVVRYVDREVQNPAYSGTCLPDRGLCLANAAITGTVPARCFSDRAMPPAKPGS